MPKIALTTPFAMNAATMEIGLGHNATTFDDYTEAISQAEFQPTSSAGTWNGIGGNTVTFGTPSTWALAVALAQDAAEDGLSWFLFDNDNKPATVRLTPTEGGPVVTANVTLSATAIGGTAGNTAAAGSATFPVQGKPTRTV